MYQLKHILEKPQSQRVLQPKLKIGKPGDKYKQEADAVAARVMRTNKVDSIMMQVNEEGEEMIQMQPVEEDEELQMKCEDGGEDSMPQKKTSVVKKELIQPKPLQESQTEAAPESIHDEINSTKGAGFHLDIQTHSFMGNRFGTDFSNVNIHTNHTAVQLNKQLKAHAFTVGSDIYFNEGQYQPDSSSGKNLLAHELTHVVQQTGTTGIPYLQKAMINDALGNPVAYEFRIGTELDAAFVSVARTLTADMTVTDVDLRSMRREALRRRGTLNDHERMFMAGLLDAANVATFNGTAVGADFRFPSNSITRARLDHVVDLDRSIPRNVERESQDVLDALTRGDLAGMVRENAELERVATQAIRHLAGSFANQANTLIGFINANNIPAGLTVRAMVSAASDNSSGDRVLAGIVYAIASQARHPFTSDLQQGNIKVDALIPAALAALPGFTGHEDAAYVTVAQEGGAKGDTMYVKTDLDPNNVYHRSVVVHELRHAQEDAGSSATGRLAFPIRNQIEARAYRSQATFIYAQLNTLPVAQQSAAAAQIASGVNGAVVVALVLEGKTNTAVNQPLFTLINNHIPAAQRLTGVQITGAFALSIPVLETRLLSIINTLYGLSNTDAGVIDGLAGESIMDWINRI